MSSLKLFKNIEELITMSGAANKQGRSIQESDLSIIKKAALVVEGERIVWIGEQKKLPRFKNKKIIEVDLKHKTVLPGFVECHTHLIFGGNRSAEFEQRLQGVSYQEIARRGGGILSTMKQTRKLSEKELLQDAQKKVQRFINQGVTTLEMKSGYALDQKNELKVLKVAKQKFPIQVVSTFLGAHALPPEFSTVESYIEFLVQKVLPQVKKNKLSNRVDIFIEKGFFEKEIACKYLLKAKAMGFDIVIHADQISLSGGADLAVELGALSADHLIQVQDPQIQKLAKSNVTCVLLPSADLYMRCAYPPARKMIEAGCRVAVATDYNPGSSPTQDLALTGLLARLEMKMSLPEVISAYTVAASHALGLSKQVGSLEKAKCANFIVSEEDWTQFFYQAGNMPVTEVYSLGKKVKIS